MVMYLLAANEVRLEIGSGFACMRVRHHKLFANASLDAKTCIGNEIVVSKKEAFDELKSLCFYAVEKLSIGRFGHNECAVVQTFP